MATLLPLLLTACGPATLDLQERPGADTAAPQVLADTATDADPDDTDAQTSEQIPGGSGAEGLCAIALSCGAEIPDEPKIPCDLQVVDADGWVLYDGLAGAETRGRSSADFPKKQYSVELWDDGYQPVEVDLLGMGSESDWILNGAYIDRALFRNVLAYELFNEMSDANYAPEVALCELTLDGAYWGVYHLTERVKRDGARIPLAADDSGETFVVKLDDEDGIWTNSSGYGTWQLVYPTSDEISPGASDAVRGWMGGWESAVLHGPAGSIFEWVSLDSAVDLVILEELTRNNDAYYLSLYLSKGPGEPMRWTPWDLDLTLGQPSYNDNENPEGWIAYRPEMIAAMGDDPAFANQLAARWSALRVDLLSDEALLARIDGYRATMGDAAYRNFEVWPIEDITFGWSGENYLYDIESHDAEIARVRDWIPRRTAWIDENIANW